MSPKQPKPEGEELLQYIDAQEALKQAAAAGIKITLPTLLNWVEKNELGFQPGGSCCRWYINSNKFQELINGKNNSAPAV